MTQKQYFKNLWKTQIGDTQSLHFWSNFDRFFLLKMAEIIIRKNFRGNILATKICKIKTNFFSPF